ncbi:hypothetical protein TNCV_2975641 [Trichonephila clavipes]|nr:hypothetical protein TNCV_2975641 [Trichonephila clavipes]
MNDLPRSPPTFQHFLEKFAYVINRDVIDCSSNFQKHPYGHQHGFQVAKKSIEIRRNSVLESKAKMHLLEKDQYLERSSALYDGRKRAAVASVIVLKEVETLVFMIEKHDEHETKGKFSIPKELHQLKYETISVQQGFKLVKKTHERKSSTCYLLITKKVSSSSPVPLKTRREREGAFQTSSCWNGVVVKRGHVSMVQNYEVRSKSPRVAEQCDVNIHSLDHECSLKLITYKI